MVVKMTIKRLQELQNMNNKITLKEQDPNQWLRVEFEKRGKMNKKVIKELRRILKVYHYDNNNPIRKEVVTSLENLLGYILRKTNA